jgi:predicted dehydrogenase
MGRRRAATAHAHPASAVALIYDEHAPAAAELAAECGAAVAASREELVAADLDIAVVATTHDALAPISTAALLAGKHVLCEKPLGRNPQESRQAVAAAERSGRLLKVGYNHRYHPAIQKLHEVCTAGEIGPLLSIRARYGHGGRPGYDRE